MTHAQLYAGFKIGDKVIYQGNYDKIINLIPSTDQNKWDNGLRLVLEFAGDIKIDEIRLIHTDEKVTIFNIELLGAIDCFEICEEKIEENGEEITTYDVAVHYIADEDIGGLDTLFSCTNKKVAEDILFLLQQIVKLYKYE